MTEPEPITVGGYNELANPNGPSYEHALSVLLAENPDISESDIVKVERQVVNGWNYRFTIQEADGTQRKIVIYVPIDYAQTVGSAQPATTSSLTSEPETQPAEPATEPTTTGSTTTSINGSPTPDAQTSTSVSSNNPTESQAATVGLSEMLIGAYQPSGSPEDIMLPLKAIHEVYTLYSLPYYEVNFAFEQIVAGKNYLIKLQHSSTPLDYAIFKVYVSLQSSITVTMVEQVLVSNYSMDEIRAAIVRVKAKHPTLEDYAVVGVTNIWPGGKGLKLLFHKDDTMTTVYVYSSEGEEQILVR